MTLTRYPDHQRSVTTRYPNYPRSVSLTRYPNYQRSVTTRYERSVTTRYERSVTTRYHDYKEVSLLDTQIIQEVCLLLDNPIIREVCLLLDTPIIKEVCLLPDTPIIKEVSLTRYPDYQRSVSFTRYADYQRSVSTRYPNYKEVRLYLPMQPEYAHLVGDFRLLARVWQQRRETESLDFSDHWLWSWLVSSLDNSCLLSTGSHLQMGFVGRGGGRYFFVSFSSSDLWFSGYSPNTLKNKG